MNKIFITGDTHGEIQIQRLATKNFREGKSLTKNDYVIICGDFGLVWNVGQPNRTEQYWLKFLDDKPWTTLFVDGNHENHHRLQQLLIEEKFGGKVGKVSDSVYHLRRGEIYTINDKKFFCFGGAYSRDRGDRKLNISYWEEEVPSAQEMQYGSDNLSKVGNKVDYIITHTVPYSVLSTFGFYPDYQTDPTTRYLEFVYNNTIFSNWFCGHLHTDIDLSKFSVVWERIIELE